MLGFGKDGNNHRTSASQAAATNTASNASRTKIAELALAVANTTGLTITPVTSAAFEVSGFERPDVLLHVGVESNPLRLHAVTHWLGTIKDEDELEVNLAVNEWNANFSWPRLQVSTDPQGGRHISADSQLLASAGWTVKQISDWILHAAGGAVGVANYAVSIWPDAELIDRDNSVEAKAILADLPGDAQGTIDRASIINPAAVKSLGSIIIQLEPLSTEGNPFHLVSMNSGVTAVTPERLAETFVGGDSWESALVDAGEGVKHASFDWKGDKVDMTVHNAVFTVETGVVLDDASEEQLAAMLARIAELNNSVDGAALSLVNIGEQEPQWLLRSLCHVSAKSGMTLAQLERYGLGGGVVTRRSLAAFRKEFNL